MEKLHLGCFDRVFEGWVNTDVTMHIFISRIPMLAAILHRVRIISAERYRQHYAGTFRMVRYMNVTKKFRFPDETFDYVYCSHLLEHLYVDQATFCVREVYRVLKRGGIFRVSVPDLDLVIANYNPGQIELFLDAIFESRKQNDKNRHHWHYNETSLKRLLSLQEFTNVVRCAFRQGRCADVSMIDNRSESLFIEAEK
jgi:ubiquinone/menaquinone biosynthesis C-methylase UbiE